MRVKKNKCIRGPVDETISETIRVRQLFRSKPKYPIYTFSIQRIISAIIQ